MNLTELVIANPANLHEQVAERLGAGEDPNGPVDSFGEPIRTALYNLRPDVVCQLIAAGANTGFFFWTPVHYAVVCSDRAELEEALELYGYPSGEKQAEPGPFSWAVRFGNHAMVEELVELVPLATLKEDQEVFYGAKDPATIRLLLELGWDTKDMNREDRATWLGFGREEEGTCRFETSGLSISREDYQQYGSSFFGRTNPARQENPYLLKMLVTGAHAGYKVPGHSAFSTGKYWCNDRFGQSHTLLPDGRVLAVAGEHEDYYDPQFNIYNDLIVWRPETDDPPEVYFYPEATFPATDFHSATLVEDYLYLIGNLGYMNKRQEGFTPVFRLRLRDYGIERVKTSGEIPGWISHHRASYDGKGIITVSGGKVWKNGELSENKNTFSLDLQKQIWRVEQ